MTTIKNGTRCKLNGGVLFRCGLVTLSLIMAVGVGAALDQTSTATHSRTVQDVSAKPAALSAKANVLKVPTDYATIQAAVNAASPGDDIKVEAGVYNENVVISTSGIRLRSHLGAVIDGAGLTGTGILVLGTAQRVADVEVSGFEVRDFQRGIVLQFTIDARITDNDIHDNNKSPGLPTNLAQAAGVDLVMANSSDVTRNSVHKNGAAGIQLRMGSTNNQVKDNMIFDNGALLEMIDMSGRGVLVTGEGTTDNEIRSNTILRTFGRGILITRPTTPPITGNLVLKNTLHKNQRCGICIMGAAQDNVVLKNDATGNNLAGLAPCLTFNLFDESLVNDTVNNTWRKNRGTSNF